MAWGMRRRWLRVRVLGVLMTIILGLIVAVRIVDWFVPHQHLVWTPLKLDAPIGFATRTKLQALRNRRGHCIAVLERGGVEVTPVPNSRSARPCGFVNAVTLEKSLVPYSAPLQMTCRLTAALALWERQVALPLARKMLGSPIVRIETFGSFACRRVNRAKDGRYSEHAHANAIDIAGFTLEDGRLVTVANHWGQSSPEGNFLKAVRDRSCRLFAAVLSPDYNKAHADHFHFDMGAWSTCR